MATRTGPLFRWALFLIFGLALLILHPGVQPAASQEPPEGSFQPLEGSQALILEGYQAEVGAASSAASTPTPYAAP